MTNSKSDASNITTDNIIKPTLEELSEDERQGLIAWRKQRREEFEVLQWKRDEEDEELYLASFKKDRQGVISPIANLEYVPLNVDINKPAVSKNLFSPEQIAEIQYYVSQGTHNVYDLMTEHSKARENTPGRPSDTQPMSQNRENQITSVIPCPTPIQSAPYSARQPSQVVGPGSLPALPAASHNSAPWMQTAPMANSSLVSAQPPTMEEIAAKFKRELDQMAYERFGFMPKQRNYTKPYPEYFDMQPYPPGYRVPEFSKFNGMDDKSTWEHISQYLAQLGEANHEHHKVRLFSLSLTGTAFSWFSALAPNSIHTWFHLEQKFHEHFYAGEVELKLSHLTSVKQKPDESVSEYVKRFRNTRNRCYSVAMTERDMADLVLNGLKSHLKEKLEGYEFMSAGQVLERALVQESRANV